MKGGAFMEYSYRFRIYPTEKQKELITKTFGCCRYVFNYFLDRRKAVYKATGKGLPLKDCTRELTALKRGFRGFKKSMPHHCRQLFRTSTGPM